MGRAPCCQKLGLKSGQWSPEEDQVLISYIQRYGHPNWRALPKQAGLLRCGKSCRLRWTNYLRPEIKRGNFSKEEEDAIISLHEMLGNRWSAIAAKLPGRTDNEIKNVWHTHLKKRLNPTQTFQESKKKNQHRANIESASEPFSLQLKYPTFDASAVASPAWSDSVVSCSGSDSSAVTGDNCNSSEEFAELDDSFWTETLSMDSSLSPMDLTTFEWPAKASISEPFSQFASSDDDVSFWLRIYMEAEELQDLPKI